MIHHIHHLPAAFAIVAIVVLALGVVNGDDRRNVGTAAVAILLIFVVLTMSGCAALSRPDELAWQGLHGVDALQTERIVGDPCYAEGHPLTRALVGTRPTSARVAAWAVGGAAVHAGVTEMLIDHDLPRVANAWEWLSLADTGWSIEQGWKVGIRIGSPNTRQPENGCRP